jgi:hypothetical protein
VGLRFCYGVSDDGVVVGVAVIIHDFVAEMEMGDWVRVEDFRWKDRDSGSGKEFLVLHLPVDPLDDME